LTGGRGFKRNLGPGAWPWWPPDGPDPAMRPVDELPPHHYFEGVGLLTMRSDWSEDAVFGSFRVGDNFWSHQHFDSGHFNIYRRGSLAIDSGTYAAGYNSDHHIKYQMQTIAHNCITVTDPDDTYPVASFWARHRTLRRALRRVGPLAKWVIAADLPNDGGQRRVGSGGYNISPDSLAHWQEARDDYEMGDILTARLDDDFVYALGDVTPAYTNSRSGGWCPDYRARTRRVRTWLRDFLYIRPELFVVFDRVSAFDRSFKKRWLLHTINEPRIEGRTVTILRDDRVRSGHNWDWGLRYAGGDRRKYYQYNGKLVVTTLLPEDARLVTVGGRGHEFDIGGHNYNEDKRGQEVVPDPLRGPDEPGSWRVEVSPGGEREDDLFLHVLVPLEADQPNPYRVTSVAASGDMVGARIAGPVEAVYVLFNRRLDRRAVDGAIRYDVARGTVATRHLLFGLSPGRLYRLDRDADSVSLEPTDEAVDEAVVVDRDGILRFALPPIMGHSQTVETVGRSGGHS
ncbi:MAG: heparinase II/III family protein, partial [Nitrospirota bacterium]